MIMSTELDFYGRRRQLLKLDIGYGKIMRAWYKLYTTYVRTLQRKTSCLWVDKSDPTFETTRNASPTPFD